jgi:hypothetical protein
MSTDLQDLLETSFGEGPAHRPIDERLLAGRRALRRRRIVATGATAAAVAALVLTPLAAGRLHGSPEQLPVTRPSQSPIDLPIAPAARVDQGSLPLLFLHGTLYRRDSTVTVERLIRPVDRGRPHTAAALLSIEGVPAWVYAAGSSAGHLSAPEGGTTLADWAQQQLHDTTTIAPGHTYADNPITREHSPVAFDGDRLVAKPGARITERIDDPAYSSSAIPSSCTARAAAVTDAGTDLFVLGYTCPHGAWDLFTEAAGPRADSLPAWLAAVKAAQDGGEGVR